MGHVTTKTQHHGSGIVVIIIIKPGPVSQPKTWNLGRVCFIQNPSLQLARSKSMDLLGQPKTQVTKQKLSRDLFFLNVFFSYLETPFLYIF